MMVKMQQNLNIMKELEIITLEELSIDEARETNGGIPLLGNVIGYVAGRYVGTLLIQGVKGAYQAGYDAGKSAT